jgi:hypothetical protein
MGKKQNKRRKRIFAPTEPDEVARWVQRIHRVDYYADVDRTFNRLGYEPWTERIGTKALIQHSQFYRDQLTRAHNMDPDKAIAIKGQVDRRTSRDLGDGRLMVSENDETWAETMVDAIAAEYLIRASFHRAGHHVFRLWPALCRALIDTELRIPSDLVKMPFNAFYFHFPVEIGRELVIDHVDGTGYPANGAYVNMPVGINAGQSAIEVRIMSEPHELGSADSDCNFHGYFIDLDREMVNEATIKRDNILSIEHDEAPSFGGPAIRLVLNALLYINSVGADVRWGESEHDRLFRDFSKSNPPKTKAKRERRKNALAVASRSRHHDAGSTLKIPSMPAESEGRTADGERKLDHRVQVRGHWRNQAYGVGRSDRRLTWIKPHYRGPEMAEVVGRRTYEVVRKDGKAVEDVDVEKAG